MALSLEDNDGLFIPVQTLEANRNIFEHFPYTEIFWYYHDGATGSNSNFFSGLTSTNVMRRYRRQNSGNAIRMEAKGTANANTGLTHNRTSEWILVHTRWQSDTYREINILALDGTEFQSTSTSSSSPTSVIDNWTISPSGVTDVSIRRWTLWSSDVTLEEARQILRGRHPLDLEAHVGKLIFHKELDSILNDSRDKGPAWDPSTGFTRDNFSISLNDQKRRYFGFLQSLSGGGSTYGVSISEGALAGETITNSATLVGSITEGAAAGDTDTNVATLLAAISEGALAGESWAAGLLYQLSITEGALAGDTIDGVVTTALQDAITEGSKAGDTFASALVAAALISEGASAGDTYSNVATLVGSISEGALAGDTWDTSMIMVSSISEGALAGDSASSVIPGAEGYATATIRIYNAVNGSPSLRNAILTTVQIKP